MKVAEGLTEASSTPNENGRMGVGATQRCCHGEKVQILKFLDWRPFDYYTQAMRSERRALFPPHFVATFEFAPRDGGGTRLTGRFRLAERGALGRFVLWLLAPLVRWFMRRTHRRLARLLAEEGDNFRRDEVEAAPEPSQAAAPR
jgi:hypothetical protein